MIELELHNKELMIARGQDSTLYFEERELKSRVRDLCELLQGVPHKILQGAQPKAAREIDASQIGRGRGLLDEIDRCVMRIAELAKERAALKPIAWGGKIGK